MALVARDFIDPDGELQPSMFVGEELSVKVGAWLNKAKENVPTDEEAQRAWVYYQAYTWVLNRLTYEPASVDIEGAGSRQYLVSQIQIAERRAARWLSIYERLASVDLDPRSYATVRSLR